MLTSFILHVVRGYERRRGFTWSPSVDLRDGRIYSALLTHTNY